MEIADLAREIRAAHHRLEHDFDPATGPAARWQEVRDLLWAAQSISRLIPGWQSNWKLHHKHPVTKWDLITDRERDSLDRTPFNGNCGSCGEHLLTEGQFARHYVVPDLQYPNLGTCWKKAAPESAGSRTEWTL